MKAKAVPAGQSSSAAASTGTLLMVWLLSSLTMLFLSSLVIYIVFMLRAEVWPPAGMPPLPPGLWLSTALIIASSFSFHFATVAVRRGSNSSAAGLIWTTLGLSLVFLGLQTANWFEIFHAGLPLKSQYGGLFYFMTLLHALHVVGGIVGLIVTGRKAASGGYSAAEFSGLGLMGMYWHFLTVIWLVLFGVLKATA